MKTRENGAGTIFKQGDKWLVRVTTGFVDGKQIQKQLGTFKKKTDANKCLKEYCKINNIFYAQRTIQDIGEELVEKAKTEKAENTYRHGYQHPFKFIKESPECEIRNLNYYYLQSIIDRAESYSIKLKIKGLISQIYKEIKKNEPELYDFSNLLTCGKRTKEKMERVYLTDEDINKLWEQKYTNMYIDMTLILVYTGLRINELLDMKVENIHLEDNYMVGGSKTEAGKDRIIPINEKIKPILSHYMYFKNEFLFQNDRKKSEGKFAYITIYKHFTDEISNIIGKTISCHDTRHTFASNMAKAGVDLYTIKRILGHAINDVTEGVYIHQDKQQLIDAVNKI